MPVTTTDQEEIRLESFRERLAEFKRQCDIYSPEVMSQSIIQNIPYGMVHELEQFLPPSSLTYSILGQPIQRFFFHNIIRMSTLPNFINAPYQPIPLGLYLCRVETPEKFDGYVPSRKDVFKKVQSYYKGKEDLKHLGNSTTDPWIYKMKYNFRLDIYRMKFQSSTNQRQAVEQFTHVFDEYAGSSNNEWFIFTEEDVQTKLC